MGPTNTTVARRIAINLSVLVLVSTGLKMQHMARFRASAAREISFFRGSDASVATILQAVMRKASLPARLALRAKL